MVGDSCRPYDSPARGIYVYLVERITRQEAKLMRCGKCETLMNYYPSESDVPANYVHWYCPTCGNEHVEEND